MGQRKTRDDELDFIDAMLQTPTVREFLAERRANRKVSRYIASAYVQDERMKNPFRGETEEEFKERQKDREDAKRFVEETQAECDERLKHAEQVGPIVQHALYPLTPPCR